jgi:hypothetical protein
MQNPDGTGQSTFALDKLFLGDTDRSGAADPSAWMQLGYNIDGVPASQLGSFCKPIDGASASAVHAEGPGGIENSFGHNILPILLGLSSTISSEIDADITNGEFSILFTLDELGSGTGYNPIASSMAQAGNLGHAAKFDGTDAWPVVSGTTSQVPSSYLVNDTWVSAPLASLNIPLHFSGVLFVLPLQHVVVTMQLDAAHKSVTNGTISGLMQTAAFQNEIVQVAGSIDPSLCSGATINAIIQQIGQASDILQDGTQDPTKSCDAISVGLGFNAAGDLLGGAVQAAPPANPCGDGG